MKTKLRDKYCYVKVLVLLLVLSLMFIIFWGLKNDVIVTRYNLEHPKIHGDFSIVLITDTHSCDYGEGQSEIIDKIMKISPDLILLGGDILDDVLPLDNGLELVGALTEHYPTYYVSGNHEIWSGEIEALKDRLRDLGVTVLEGQSTEIEIRGNIISLLGLDDPDIGMAYNTQLKNLSTFRSENLTLLLAHRPERVEDYNLIDTDFVFSGHSHGGQWRFPFFLENGLLAPNQGFFPKLTCGVHAFSNFQLVISRGLSRESTNIPRFFNPPELIELQFRSTK